jgi:hypothetical protein
LSSWVVKRKFASGNRLDSQAQFEDLRLKYCIQEKNAKNTLTGRGPYFFRKFPPSAQI